MINPLLDKSVKIFDMYNPRFIRHGVWLGSDNDFIFFDDVKEGVVAIPIHTVRQISPEKKIISKDIKRVDSL